MNKEEIYDSKLNPLVAQIINICHENKIAMLMSFAIQTEDDPELACTTALLSDKYEALPEQIEAYRAIMDGVG